MLIRMQTLSAVILSLPMVVQAANYQCENKRYCKEMRTCTEAVYYLQQCKVKRLDRDSDGIPCESICGKSKSAMQKKLEQGR